MEQEKTDIDERQDSTLFFIRTILKEQWDSLKKKQKNKIKTRLKSIQKTFNPSLENRNMV